MIAEPPTTQTYQALRPYLFTVAYRMTGSASDAEDLVHDAWIRYLDAGAPAVESVRAYLTTIVSRLSLNHLKSARVTREQYTGTWMPEPVLTADAGDDPADAVEQRESLSLAVLMLMEELTPDQRVVYVLREGYGLAYDEIATHVDKTAAACRQIFARARRRMDEQEHAPSPPPATHRQIIERFMDAFFRGDAHDLASLLADDASWSADGGPDRLAVRHVIRGRDHISRAVGGAIARVPTAMELVPRIIDINGAPAVALFDHGKLDSVMDFETGAGHVRSVRVLRNPHKLAHLARALGTEPNWESPEPRPRRAKRRSATVGIIT